MTIYKKKTYTIMKIFLYFTCPSKRIRVTFVVWVGLTIPIVILLVRWIDVYKRYVYGKSERKRRKRKRWIDRLEFTNICDLIFIICNRICLAMSSGNLCDLKRVIWLKKKKIWKRGKTSMHVLTRCPFMLETDGIIWGKQRLGKKKLVT